MQIRIFLIVAACCICRPADAQSPSDEQLIAGLNAVRKQGFVLHTETEIGGVPIFNFQKSR